MTHVGLFRSAASKHDSYRDVNLTQAYAETARSGGLNAHQTSEMERAAAMGNSRKLFHIIRVTGRKALGVSETVYEADGSPIHNQQRRLERWVEHFEAQFRWLPVSASHTAIPAHVPWFVSTDPPSEAKIRKEI
ncbi:unnamed protein product [Echinostoma caproni]|uniref:Uncharacterized protein n=1 Tax=Echinostoma caproni TaxID=27848 RepID=A0A3P8HG30_9TREM|nr:unnamed protein product [Echinostoma caproni]